MDIDASVCVGLLESTWIDSNLCYETSVQGEYSLHETVFSPSPRPLLQSSHEFCAALVNISALSQDILNITAHSNILPSPKAGNCGGSGGIGYEWDSEGRGSAYMYGEVHDDEGDYVEGEIRQNDDGSGSASISGGRK